MSAARGGRGAGWTGGAQARRPRGCATRAMPDALRLDLRTADQARAAYRELSGSPAGDGARVLVERMAPPGVELLVAARADAVVPALVVGLGGIWAEALDDVAIVPLPADAERVEAAIRSLRGAAGARAAGAAATPVDLAQRRRARRGGGPAAARGAASICSSSTRSSVHRDGAWRSTRSPGASRPDSLVDLVVNRTRCVRLARASRPPRTPQRHSPAATVGAHRAPTTRSSSAAGTTG